MKYSRQERLLREYVRESLTTNEGFASTAGHLFLDLAGVIPGVGESADAVNALWYAKDGDYLSAVLSLISMIPVVGDAIGKSGKVALWIARAGKTGRVAKDAGKKAVQLAKWISKNDVKVRQVLDAAGANEKLAQHVDGMEAALDDFVGKYTSPEAIQQIQQMQQQRSSG